MTQKNGKDIDPTETAKDKEMTKRADPQVGREIKDFGLYRVEVAPSTVKEMEGRVIYAVINNDTGVVEEECSVLPQALLHAGQFNKEMRNDHWEERLNPQGGVMRPTGPQIVQ